MIELLESRSTPVVRCLGWSGSSADRGMRIGDPTALAALVTPELAAIVPSCSQWVCRWLGRQLRRLKHVAWVMITNGLPASAYLVPGAKHVLCRVHHQQAVPQ